MRFANRRLPGCLLLLAALAGAPRVSNAGDTTLRIGIPQTFFHDMSAAVIREVTDPFAEVLRETTGLRGQAITGGDAFAVARQLHDDKLQLAILHGFEFAWAQKKDADLLPLMIAVRTDSDFRAHLLVRKAGGPASFADLKGKDIAVPRRTKESCRRYLQHLCRQSGVPTPADYFGRIVRPTDVETGLDDLARGKYPAALVDSNSLAFYKDLKPGVFARLKVLQKSDVFAPVVIAYHKGAVPEATLKRIRDGLRLTAKTEAGRDVMKLWHATGFATVPNDFADTLAASLKTYPPPTAAKLGR